MKEITEELLQTIYTRANQYAITKWGSEPDRLELTEDGIVARWINYRCGETDEETEYISVDNLTEDLDDVARQRKEQLERERIQREERQKREAEQRAQREKEQRRAKYLELQKEFGNN